MAAKKVTKKTATLTAGGVPDPVLTLEKLSAENEDLRAQLAAARSNASKPAHAPSPATPAAAPPPAAPPPAPAVKSGGVLQRAWSWLGEPL